MTESSAMESIEPLNRDLTFLLVAHCRRTGDVVMEPKGGLITSFCKLAGKVFT